MYIYTHFHEYYVKFYQRLIFDQKYTLLLISNNKNIKYIIRNIETRCDHAKQRTLKHALSTL